MLWYFNHYFCQYIEKKVFFVQQWHSAFQVPNPPAEERVWWLLRHHQLLQIRRGRPYPVELVWLRQRRQWSNGELLPKHWLLFRGNEEDCPPWMGCETQEQDSARPKEVYFETWFRVCPKIKNMKHTTKLFIFLYMKRNIIRIASWIKSCSQCV